MSKLSWRIRNSKFVVWETPPSGDKMAAFDHPEVNLNRVWYSSTFDYYKAAAIVSSTVTHQAVAPATYTMGSVTYGGQFVTQDQVLYTHGLGYVPRFKVAIGAQLIQNGHPVQVAGNRCRQIAFYATASQIHAVNIGCSDGASALDAVSVTYQLLVFKNRDVGVDPSLPVFSGKRGILARGHIRKTDRVLRRADARDASPFDINLSIAVDIGNGGVRWFPASGGTVDFGGYSGGAGAPSNIQCAL